MPQMLKLPTPLRPVNDATLTGPQVASVQHADMSVRAHAQRARTRPDPVHVGRALDATPPPNLHDRLPTSNSTNRNGTKMPRPICQAPRTKMPGIQRVTDRGA